MHETNYSISAVWHLHLNWCKTCNDCLGCGALWETQVRVHTTSATYKEITKTARWGSDYSLKKGKETKKRKSSNYYGGPFQHLWRDKLKGMETALNWMFWRLNKQLNALLHDWMFLIAKSFTRKEIALTCSHCRTCSQSHSYNQTFSLGKIG